MIAHQIEIEMVIIGNENSSANKHNKIKQLKIVKQR